MPFSRSPPSRANIRCGSESPRKRSCRHSRNSGSASSPSALWARASSRARSTRTPRSTAPTSATSFLASRRRLERRTRPWSRCSAKLQSRSGRRLPKSRSPGCLPRSRGSFLSPVPRSCTASSRTSERLASNSPPTISATSRARFPRRGTGRPLSGASAAAGRSLSGEKMCSLVAFRSSPTSVKETL